MAIHRVDLRTYLRILSCAALGGGYFALAVVPLTLFLNSPVPSSPNVLAHLVFYLVPSYGIVATAVYTVLGCIAQPFLVRPLARRVLDPVTVSWLLLVDLALLAVGFWCNHAMFEGFLSPRQHAHLLRASMGLTILFALALTAHAIQFLFPKRRRWARVALLVLAAVGAYFPFAQRRAAFTAQRRHTLVLDVVAEGTPLRVIAIDGLALSDIRRLGAAGKLPTFGRLLAEGTSIMLRTITPCDPQVTWTTVATGKLPWRHGVADAFVFGFAGLPDRFRLTPRYLLFRSIASRVGLTAAPVLRTDRQALPFWSLLSRSGMVAGVVNWPATYPAEPLRGFVVSDYLGKPYYQFGTALSGITHPERLAPLAVRQRVQPADIPDAVLDALIPPSPLTSQDAASAGRLREILKGARAADLTTRAMGILFSSRFLPKVLVLRYEGLATSQRYFLRYHHPEAFGDVPAEQVKSYGRVIESYYGFLDGLLEEQMQALPQGGILVVVSSAGMEPLTTLGRIVRLTRDPLVCGSCIGGPDGMMLLWGGNVPRGVTAGPRRITDVAPTILYAQGLPVARDMDGEPVFEAFSDDYKSRTPVTTIASYEAARTGPSHGVLTAQPVAPADFGSSLRFGVGATGSRLRRSWSLKP